MVEINLFQKFLEIINLFLPRDPFVGKEEALAQLDPDKIYVENVRSLLNVSSKTAKEICDMAARKGLFKKQVEVMCPDGSVAAIADAADGLPDTVRCQIEQEDGALEERALPTNTLRKSVFYKLNETSSVAHA